MGFDENIGLERNSNRVYSKRHTSTDAPRFMSNSTPYLGINSIEREKLYALVRVNLIYVSRSFYHTYTFFIFIVQDLCTQKTFLL